MNGCCGQVLNERSSIHLRQSGKPRQLFTTKTTANLSMGSCFRVDIQLISVALPAVAYDPLIILRVTCGLEEYTGPKAQGNGSKARGNG